MTSVQIISPPFTTSGPAGAFLLQRPARPRQHVDLRSPPTSGRRLVRHSMHLSGVRTFARS